eukprot:TRINITY_DN177_c0_g1_i2.p3 TRINITY_DN177_c0_g1~~TRINITY_DN177_c0_g1_i2.p3  ORF type:complete len:133 (+),score=20.84 TRINITY_DN177_c0_g1_i2:194-592(+)
MNTCFMLFVLLVVGVYGIQDIGGLQLGGIEMINLDEVDTFTAETVNSTAKFAVDEINRKVEEGTLVFTPMPAIPLEFVEVVSVQSQVTTGTLYYLVIQTLDANNEEAEYSVRVQVMPWLADSMQLVGAELVE